ncbi:MAG: carboxypeptidase-like regulatory domain-containing protein, partial [Planctomycetota bacterium]
MSDKSKLSLATIAVLVAAAGLWGLWIAHDAGPGPERATPSASPARAARGEAPEGAGAQEATGEPALATGTVFVEDELRRPLPGAHVEAHRSAYVELGAGYSSEDQFYAGGRRSEPVATAVTDATGRAAFRHAPKQTFLYLARKDGYARGYSKRVELRWDGEPDPVTIRLGPAHPLSGRVLDGQGRPIAAAIVLAADLDYQATVPTY